jgi:hypothetical protein
MALKIGLYKALIRIHGREDVVVYWALEENMAARIRLSRALVRIHGHEDVVLYWALGRKHGRKD